MPGVTFGDTRWVAHLDDHVSCLVVSPDGCRAVAASLGGDAFIIDLESGEFQSRLPDHPLGVLSAAWSADGRKVATGGQDGCLRVMSAAGEIEGEYHPGGWVTHLA